MAEITIAPPASTTTANSTPALLVTSSASRSNYADNVSKLQSITSSLPSSNPSVVDYLNSTGMPSDYNSRAQMAAKYGITGYTGSAAQNTQLLNILKSGGQASSTASPTASSKTTANPPAGTTPAAGANPPAASSPAPSNNGTASSASPAAPSSPSTSTGTTPNTATGTPVFGVDTGHAPTGETRNITGPDGNQYTIDSNGEIVSGPSSGSYVVGQNISQYPNLYSQVTGNNASGSSIADTNGIGAGLDPTLKAQYETSIANLDKGIADAKSALDAAQSTLQNDPAALAAVAAIQQKYDRQIELMKEKNHLLLGGYVANAARSGGLQYANDMTSNFLSEEQDKATQRITDLVNQETELILKTQQAYKNGDIKALNEAMKAYDDANRAKLDAIQKLFTATNQQVKTLQAQQKIDQAQAKQQISDDIRISAQVGKTIADQIKASGVTDPNVIDAYIRGMADKSGIRNIDILKGAVTSAQQALAKTDATLANTANNIKNRDKRTQIAAANAGKKSSGGGTGKYKNFSKPPSASTVTKVNAYLQSIGGNQAAIDEVNSNEILFYKVYNAIPKKSASSSSDNPPITAPANPSK